MVTAIVLITAVALLVGLMVVLQRRRTDSVPRSRDTPHTDVTREGGHQGRSPGADGGGHSYLGGGGA